MTQRQSIPVMSCSNANCRGDEEGCNGSECRRADWTDYTTELFREIYGREPYARRSKMAASGDMVRAALLSECGTYRYWLTRTWVPNSPRICFLMLNPSTADANVDDPTIRRCIDFAKACGYGGLIVVNLYALRTPKPAVLQEKILSYGKAYAFGPLNDASIEDAVRTSEVVVLAYGANGGAAGKWMAAHVRTLGKVPHVLALTAHGEPRHPLYLKKTCKPFPFKQAVRKS